MGKALRKKLVFNFGNEFGDGFLTDNLEGLQLVYKGSDEAYLIVMSDDNFSAFGPQASQFAVLKLYGEF